MFGFVVVFFFPNLSAIFFRIEQSRKKATLARAAWSSSRMNTKVHWSRFV